jgi:hypothetical protein
VQYRQGYFSLRTLSFVEPCGCRRASGYICTLIGVPFDDD